jgi:hypothetical protein
MHWWDVLDQLIEQQIFPWMQKTNLVHQIFCNFFGSCFTQYSINFSLITNLATDKIFALPLRFVAGNVFSSQ